MGTCTTCTADRRYDLYNLNGSMFELPELPRTVSVVLHSGIGVFEQRSLFVEVGYKVRFFFLATDIMITEHFDLGV